MPAPRSLTAEKLAQAQALIADSEADVWLIFVRETAAAGDPALPLISEVGFVWQAALLVSADARVAVVGNYDAPPLESSGDWDEVIPYVEDIKGPLLSALENLVDADVAAPRLAVNISENDVMADGLSAGMHSLLGRYLAGSRFEGGLKSAEGMVSALRAQKTETELTRIRGALRETDELFAEIALLARPGISERAVYDAVQRSVESRGLGYAWDPVGDPIVNSGPESMIGHGIPSETICIAFGHIFHVDLGVRREGYCSDIQRCWYVPAPGETQAPEDVLRALDAVNGAIDAGAAALRPGAAGWEVDAAARAAIQEAGYEEYLHALGHQVGRLAHDGGTVLGPRWARYGRTPFGIVAPDEVYTLELGVMVEGRGYLGIEEMVRVRSGEPEWLSERQRSMPLLGNGQS
jgi:Xaa-Pro dipeptidase